ncbi:hypothetical protein FB45DRAFT_746021 [Roridomyces roridus]|uniref:Uncharacterized protein n=1 Tax=Roridomyces roridus TaxID=1738132 RepID=A0AAD7BW67_9AGAR|nr:hypothetical protein FB45DRAFT_746021 [Roridomyces roridus]
MSSSSSHNSSRRRSAATHAPRRRPLARSNSSLLGALKNIVTAPLAWFATAEDFEDTPDLKGKRRRHLAPPSGAAADDSEDPPRSKRPRPPYVSQTYAQSPSGYLDPPNTVFDNNSSFFRANSVNIPAPTLNHLNTSTRSGLSRTMSIDPPSRDTPRYSTPLDRDISMEASSFIRTSIPRDHSMPLPPTRSLRMRTSLTPQPAQPREVSEPPPISSLAQRPVFVRPPSESHQRLSSQSSSSTLGSLVESQRSTRSPIRQHSLLFGSGPQAQPTRQPPPAERALHELDVYKTPLLPTRSRLRTTAASAADPALPPSIIATADTSDMFRPRRSSQLVLMREDRRPNALGRKSKGKTNKAKVNETKPYAGEGGMKKLLARRLKEVQADEEQDPVSQPEGQTVASAEDLERVVSQPLPPPPGPSDWQKNISAQSATSGSSLRVGRTKTSRAHIARPGRPSKFSAAFVEEVDDSMEDEEETRRQKERQELEETAKMLPTFNVPSGFTFAKEPNAKPVEFDASAKEPPIVALPFSFGKPAVPAEPVVPVFVPTAVQEPKPTPAFSFANDTPSSGPEKTAPSEGTNTGAVPNFFASSKFVSQAPVVSTLLPPATPLFGSPSDSIVPASLPVDPSATPKPAAASTPALPSIAPTPIKDSQNPLWDGESSKGGSSLFGSGTLPKADSIFGGSTLAQPVSIFGASKKDEPSLFGASKPQEGSGFLFGVSSSTPVAPPSLEPSKTGPKADTSLGSMSSETSTSVGTEAPKAPAFAFGQPAAAAPVTEPKPLFGAPPAASNPFASSAPAASEAPKPAFGGFTFGQPAKEQPNVTPAASSPFTFGPPSTAPATDTAKPAAASPFTFGPSAPASTPAFGFGASSSTDTAKPAASGGMFSFGTPTVIPPTARPVTPPKNEMQEFKMEESPTRDMQTNVDTKAAEPRPTLGGGGSGFSFGNSNPPSGSSLFGQASAAPAPAPFSFGASSSTANPFAAPTPTENKPFDFGRSSNPSTSSPFAFGQNNNGSVSSSIDPPRPSTTGSFSFGSSSGASTGTGFPFASGNQTTASPFASLPSGGSAPSSPSTFSQPFSFGASAAPSQPAPFSFGSSQPVSPAGGSSNLPQQPSTPGGFGGGSFGAQPASPFGAPAQGGGGSSLFTMGSAPPPPAASGNTSRVMKKLPRRK